MSNIVPSRDGLLQVANLILMLGNGQSNDPVGVLRQVNGIFSYNGPRTPEVDKVVTDIRATFQEVNSCIAAILADLPE